jgi:hypothetical protein
MQPLLRCRRFSFESDRMNVAAVTGAPAAVHCAVKMLGEAAFFVNE